MSANGKPEHLRLGFLTVIKLAERGFMGGLLVTNHLGRPLEFQCTAPLKPNRTQEILYGPTLVPFILSDLIGRTLIEKVGVKPDIILTEMVEMLELRALIDLPIACIGELEADRDGKAAEKADSSGEAGSATVSLRMGRQRLRMHSAHHSDRALLERRAALVPKDADLNEPFERVREALEETSKTGASP